jgi:hypothetical protein
MTWIKIWKNGLELVLYLSNEDKTILPREHFVDSIFQIRRVNNGENEPGLWVIFLISSR